MIGVVLLCLSVAMLVPALADYYTDDKNVAAFVTSSMITAFFGASLYLASRSSHQKEKNLNVKTAFLMTAITWLSVASFAALPFYFSNIGMTIADCFFESMSGLTATGATVLTNLEMQPAGILIWRAISQWLGGIGIIVLAMSILPLLKIGGMQLFQTEFSDKSEKVLPRASQIAGAIFSVYLILTFVCVALLYAVGGMSLFDAFCHALATVSTGGFSTSDLSVGKFNSITIEVTLIIFMILSAIPFVLYVKLINGRKVSFLKDDQVRFFLVTLTICVLIATFWLYLSEGRGFFDALRVSAFNVVSVISTTGFATEDYYKWGSAMVVFFYIIYSIGGCTGSTAGGIKIFRFKILFENTKCQMNKLIHPHGVFRPKFNDNPIDGEATLSVLSFIVLYASCFCVVSFLLSLDGLDYTTSISAAVTTLGNVGPGLGSIIGPAGNYQPLSDFAKWVCTFAMLIGRLELFTILVLFLPYYWKN